jgi:hypothetical protein
VRAPFQDSPGQLDRTKEESKKEPDGQRSLTDPDARSMNSQATGSGLVGYNVQAAVELN